MWLLVTSNKEGTYFLTRQENTEKLLSLPSNHKGFVSSNSYSLRGRELSKICFLLSFDLSNIRFVIRSCSQGVHGVGLGHYYNCSVGTKSHRVRQVRLPYRSCVPRKRSSEIMKMAELMRQNILCWLLDVRLLGAVNWKYDLPDNPTGLLSKGNV